MKFHHAQLVRVKTIFFVTEGWVAWGCKHPSGCYWNPSWTVIDMGSRRISQRPLLPGLVLRADDARNHGEIPDIYKTEGCWEIYQVLIGDEPPLWFPWRDLKVLKETDTSKDIMDIEGEEEDWI